MRILVTAIGSFSADCVIGSLKKNGHYVVGCDIYPGSWHANAKDCDNFYQAPKAVSDDFIPFLLEVCKTEKIDYIFPLTDIEIDVINSHRTVFHEHKVKPCIQSQSCLEISRNKLELSKKFRNDGLINIPVFTASEDLNTDFELPAIAKPINGRSSEGLSTINNIEELRQIRKKKGYIIQQKIEGSVFTVDYIRGSNGADFAVPREELLRTKNGAGTTVRIDPSPILKQMVSHIGSTLGIVGCVNIEFIHSDNRFYLIDLNPRFSAGVAFTQCVGYDLVANHLNCFVGKEIDPGIAFDEKIICKRYYEEVI